MKWREWLEDASAVYTHLENTAAWVGDLVDEIAETRSREEREELVQEFETIARDLLETARAIYRLYWRAMGKEGSPAGLPGEVGEE